MSKELKLFKACRETSDYKYSDIAKALGISKAYAWQICNGKRKLYYEQAMIIAALFNMTPDELFYQDFLSDKKLKEQVKNAKTL